MSPLPPIDDRPEAFEARGGQVTAAEFNLRLVNQVRRIRAAEDEYRQAIDAWVDAERDYKRAQAIVVAMIEPDSYKNAGERDAKAELMPLAGGGTVNDLRRTAHRAEAMVNACKLACQHRAGELSALQSEAALAKDELRLATYGPSGAEGP